jgi:starch-binding outer membrane protein, SusD/RagB family
MRFSYFLLILIVFASTSCNKLLEKRPSDFLSPTGYYTTEAELQSALAGVYDILYNIYGTNILYREGIEADEGYYQSNTLLGLHLYTFNASEPRIYQWWSGPWLGISRANVLLANVDNQPNIPQTVRDQIRGEAMFLRGYYYYVLVRAFGGVPIILKPVVSATDTDVPRSTEKEVYDQILKDMTTSEKLVADINTLGFGGRVSKSAVQGILARVCLAMAGNPLKDVSKYKDASAWAKKVIDSRLHSLNPVYSNIFINYAQDKYDIKESIWEVEFWGNRFGIYTETGQVGGVNGPSSANSETGVAVGGLFATAKLYKLYEPGDLRRDWAIANFTYNKNGPNGSKTYITDTTTSSLYNRAGGKWRREYELVTPKSAQWTPQNLPLLRYSDVLLMYAEAENEINNGPTPEAYNAINQVRMRAFGKLLPGAVNPNEHDLKGLNHDSFFKQIVDERSRELSFELLRKPDLIRWGLFVSVMHQTGDQISADVPGAYYTQRYYNVTDKNVVYPIPESELSTNKALVQTPGW